MPPFVSYLSRHWLLVLVAWWLVLAPVPATAGDEPVEATAEVTADAETLEAADRRLNQAAAERDRAAFRELLSPEVVFLAGEPHRGRVEVLAIWQHLFEGKYDFRHVAETLETTVADSGELGWAIGSVRTSFQRPGVDAEEVIEGHYLNVWTHTDAGWRVAYMASLVVHPTLGAARDPRGGLMTAWPDLADQVDAHIALDWRPTTTVRAESGELAYTFGEYSASFAPPPGEASEADSEPIAGDGVFLAVWRKDDQGRWQLAGEGFTPPGIYGDRTAEE